MDEIRWLNETEMRAWRGLLSVDRLLFEQLGRELGVESGLSMADYEVLVQLSEAPGRRLRMTELAGYAMSSKSRLSHQIGRLSALGWVVRESCPDDRRGAFAVLTDAGFDVLAAAAPGHLRSVRRHLFDHLTEEDVAALARVTGKIVSHLEGTMARLTMPAGTPVVELTPDPDEAGAGATAARQEPAEGPSTPEESTPVP